MPEYSSVDIFLVYEDGYIKELTEPVVEGSLLSITFSNELSLMSCSCEFEVQKKQFKWT
jgi:hypothetical protein